MKRIRVPETKSAIVSGGREYSAVWGPRAILEVKFGRFERCNLRCILAEIPDRNLPAPGSAREVSSIRAECETTDAFEDD